MTAYAAEAKAHGAVYLEAIFGPADSVRSGASWNEVLLATATGRGRPGRSIGGAWRAGELDAASSGLSKPSACRPDEDDLCAISRTRGLPDARK